MIGVAWLLSVARSFFDAFVVLKLWQWFVVPLGAPSISYWHAYGLDLIIGYVAAAGFGPGDLWTGQKAKGEKPGANISLVITKGILFAVTLGVGAVVRHLMGAA